MGRPATMEDAKQVALRLPAYWLDRVDVLASTLSTPAVKVRRTSVLRMAIHRGMESLEAALAKPKPKPRPKPRPC